MNKKLEVKNFELRSMSLTGKCKLKIEFFDLTQPQDIITVKSDQKPHDDLIAKFEEFRTPFAKSLGLLRGWEFSRDHIKKNDERLKEAMQNYHDEILRCTVSELTITDKGVYLKGALDCDGTKSKIPSPYIKFEDEENDYGKDCEIISKELSVEVWKFIYQGKRSNDLFNQKEDKSGLGTNTDAELKKVS